MKKFYFLIVLITVTISVYPQYVQDDKDFFDDEDAIVTMDNSTTTSSSSWESILKWVFISSVLLSVLGIIVEYIRAKKVIPLTPAQQNFLQIVKQLFYSNTVMDMKQVLEKCGVDTSIPVKDVDDFYQLLPFQKDTNEANIFMAYLTAIYKRYDLAYEPLKTHEEYISVNINLHNDEHIYLDAYNVNFYEEKTIANTFSYAGLRWNSGPLRMGTFSTIGNDVTRFTVIDVGELYITNTRIILIGGVRNVTKIIVINNIVYFNLYQDGILIHEANKKPTLLKFGEKDDFGILFKADSLNQFCIVIDRIIKGNYMQEV